MSDKLDNTGVMDINEVIKQLDTVSHTFFTVSEVAEFTRISYLSVWRMINSGEMTATKIGGQWRIPKDSLIAYLRGRTSGGGQL